MNLSEFRRYCENRNNSDEQIKATIMQAIRDGKDTAGNRTELLAILEELRPVVHACVQKSLVRHERRAL